MNKNKIIISILIILTLITTLMIFFVNKKEKQITNISNEYKNIAILVNGVSSESIPTDKYYYMSSSCNGMNLEWNVLEKKLKIKGTETVVTNPSCTLNFEEVNVDIQVNGVTNFNPTGDLIISEKNCSDAEVTYSNNKLNIKFNSKPTTCVIKLKDPLTTYNQILADNTALSDSSINFAQISSDANGKGLYYTSTTTYGEENTRFIIIEEE